MADGREERFTALYEGTRARIQFGFASIVATADPQC
jgi:hypothetical protein